MVFGARLASDVMSNLLHRTRTNLAKMTMTVALSSRLSAIVLGSSAALALISVSVPPTRAQVACMINGEPITNYDIEQRSKLLMLSTHKMPDRQQVINELTDEKLKITGRKKIQHRSFGWRYRSVL